MRGVYKTAFIRWVVVTLWPLHWSCQRFDFYAEIAFVWLSSSSICDWKMTYYRRFCRTRFYETAWRPPDLFLSLAFVTLLLSYSFKNRWREQLHIQAHATLRIIQLDLGAKPFTGRI
jgi:hypothetical protein